MVDSHCEILWDNKSGSDVGFHPTADYGAASDFPEKQAIIAQQHLMSSMLGLCSKNSLTNDSKHKLRTFKISYT